MYNKCSFCGKYIEENEETCVDCDIFHNEEFNYDQNSEMIVEEYGDNDFLNEKGASLVRK